MLRMGTEDRCVGSVDTHSSKVAYLLYFGPVHGLQLSKFSLPLYHAIISQCVRFCATRHVQPVVGPGFLHRADVAKAMSGYNPEEKFFDLDLWMRINTLFGPRREEQGKTYVFFGIPYRHTSLRNLSYMYI